jgi:hypothetical protein
VEGEGFVNRCPITTASLLMDGPIAIAAAFKANKLNSVRTCLVETLRNIDYTIVFILTPVSSPPVERSIGRNSMDKCSINNHTTTKSPVKANAELTISIATLNPANSDQLTNVAVNATTHGLVTNGTSVVKRVTAVASSWKFEFAQKLSSSNSRWNLEGRR